MKTVNFTEMKNGTKEDYELLEKFEKSFERQTADRVLNYLSKQTTTLEGYKITRLEHSLQAATRAFKNKESDEMVVATLLHDIGDDLAPMNHSQYAASILRPYVSERTYWIVLHHGLFQTYYSAHHLGGDRNARDKFKDHKYYQDTIDFCEKYDQCSFDPDYKSMTLDDFKLKIIQSHTFVIRVKRALVIFFTKIYRVLIILVVFKFISCISVTT